MNVPTKVTEGVCARRDDPCVPGIEQSVKTCAPPLHLPIETGVDGCEHVAKDAQPDAVQMTGFDRRDQ